MGQFALYVTGYSAYRIFEESIRGSRDRQHHNPGHVPAQRHILQGKPPPQQNAPRRTAGRSHQRSLARHRKQRMART
jgi:hypothetical protein